MRSQKKWVSGERASLSECLKGKWMEEKVSVSLSMKDSAEGMMVFVWVGGI